MNQRIQLLFIVIITYAQLTACSQFNSINGHDDQSFQQSVSSIALSLNDKQRHSFLSALDLIIAYKSGGLASKDSPGAEIRISLHGMTLQQVLNEADKIKTKLANTQKDDLCLKIATEYNDINISYETEEDLNNEREKHDKTAFIWTDEYKSEWFDGPRERRRILSEQLTKITNKQTAEKLFLLINSYKKSLSSYMINLQMKRLLTDEKGNYLLSSFEEKNKKLEIEFLRSIISINNALPNLSKPIQPVCSLDCWEEMSHLDGDPIPFDLSDKMAKLKK
ncbi:hypothetical protein [Shewanella cyperi]|uniref:hypothetical protein n=1 Tax=Shewanella cyperi TaxID=2814292 RepID=UPI001A94441B|nr:hypothetical protein [Shewanella cyperi]QSX39776.1 hypothetical protein JYB84_12225 [Shewanella cyperi]